MSQAVDQNQGGAAAGQQAGQHEAGQCKSMPFLHLDRWGGTRPPIPVEYVSLPRITTVSKPQCEAMVEMGEEEPNAGYL